MTSFFLSVFFLQERPLYAETVGAASRPQLPASVEALSDADAASLQFQQEDLAAVAWLGVRHSAPASRRLAPAFCRMLAACRFAADIPLASASWASAAPETLSALDLEVTLPFLFLFTKEIASHRLLSMERFICIHLLHFFLRFLFFHRFSMVFR